MQRKLVMLRLCFPETIRVVEMHNRGDMVQAWSNIGWLDAKITKAYTDHTYWHRGLGGIHQLAGFFGPIQKME